MLEYLKEVPKVYKTVFKFGIATDTNDAAGKIIKKTDCKPVPLSKIKSILPDFIGEIEQIPPDVSAVWVDGKRAYDLARSGKKFNLKPRHVKVFSIEITDYDFPLLTLVITTGPGTYIRSIARDLGDKVGCPAVVEQLTRTRVGPFHLKDALSVEDIKNLLRNENYRDVVVSPEVVFSGFPELTVNQRGYNRIVNGRKLARSDLATPEKESAHNRGKNQSCLHSDVWKKRFKIVDPGGRIIAVVKKQNDEVPVYVPEKVFITRGS